ncbi:hypothetical protein PLICRDRAFT_110168 [Plicaturopsis crispa FD-325 SS-3]|nr:hypothetical protein PLICRDRAFT_110168 [Plicaturopsis crispa FD-325 SS-3]
MLARLTTCGHLRAAWPLVHARSYALSRFPEKQVGSGRKPRRETLRGKSATRERPSSPPFDTLEREERPSSEDSDIWGQRSPARNPQEGLGRLLLGHDTLVVTRQIEMANIFLGFEQTNKYVISNEEGETLGYIAEEPRSLLSIFTRQVLHTHRPFRALVMDLHGDPILWLRRPFTWINSRMFVQRVDESHAQGEPVLDTFAEVQQRWHLWRRRYDLFLREKQRHILSTVSEAQPEPETDLFRQFAVVDQGFLAWSFSLRDGRGQQVASVNRAFRGFGREIFTDTGRYFVRFGEDPNEAFKRTAIIRDLTLEERASILALAINIDFDYFSRHSGCASRRLVSSSPF